MEQRFRSGLTYLVPYTISKTMEAISFLNASDQRPSRELSTFDTPRRFVVSGFYELPVGPRKSLLSKRLVSHIVGGWQVTWTSVIQSGPPMSYPDYYIYGNPRLTSGQTLSRWFNTSKDIWVQRPADTLRTTPMRSPNTPPHGAAGRPGIDQAVLHPGRSQI